MRLNPKTLPTYFALHKTETALTIPVAPEISKALQKKGIDKLLLSANDLLVQDVPHYYVAKSFMDAIDKAADKIIDDGKHTNTKKNDAGLMFLPNHNFLFYLVNPEEEGENWKAMAIMFNATYMRGFVVLNNEDKLIGAMEHEADYKNGALVNEVINWVMLFSYFVHNCEVEQVVVDPTKKLRYGNERHYNEAGKQPYIILDCRWFTEIIRDAPFHVNGFLRWQPCGLRNTQRKLIWVEEHERKGYHRKANKPENF